MLKLAIKKERMQSNSFWLYRKESILKESILTALVEWIPRVPSIVLRNLVYRSLFAKIDNSSRIQSGDGSIDYLKTT